MNNNIKLDLGKLYGFKIVATATKEQQAVLAAKIGQKSPKTGSLNAVVLAAKIGLKSPKTPLI